MALSRIGWTGIFGWDELLRSRRVLIVSEAGAGKTYECQTQQRVLWNNGEPAFYLDLASLAKGDLRGLLSAPEEERLDAWLVSQSNVATFFLDSLDELKLTLGSFQVALKRFSKSISSQLARARIVITTRPIPFDQQLIRDHLPVPESSEFVASGDSFADIAMGRNRSQTPSSKMNGIPDWRHVALMPLSLSQIREMAATQGVENLDMFISAINDRDALDFAQRPQDLIEICADWRDSRAIRTHCDQVKRNVAVKLNPREDRHEVAEISQVRAEEGASRLALAALLARKLTIRHSAEADVGGQPGTALDPAAILPDWSLDERKTLLERALFGFASYGRVRFHHRSVIDFLAAKRIEDLLSRGMSIKAVKRLLFSETPQGIKVIKPTMRPVAAWLALTQLRIFTDVRDREPETLINYGDPMSLTAPQRADVLRAYVQQYGPGDWRGMHVPHIQVRRFATAELSPEVQRLWKSGIENGEVRELLLELIGAAPMPDCADIAFDVALSKVAESGERLDAIGALVRLGDQRVELVTQSLLESPEIWPDRLARGVTIQLFPGFINPDQLGQLLVRLERSRKIAGEMTHTLSHRLAGVDVTTPYLSALRERLTEVVQTNLTWKAYWPNVVGEHSNLAPLLAAICLQLIERGHLDFELLRSCIVAVAIAQDRESRDDSVQMLRDCFTEMDETNRETAFWLYDALLDSLQPRVNPTNRLYDVSHHGPVTLSPELDRAWVTRCLADPNRRPIERTMMLLALMRTMWDGKTDRRDYLEKLRDLVVDVPELSAIIEDELRPRSVDPKTLELESELTRLERANEQRSAKDHRSWIEFWRELAEHPETAFSPERAGNTAWNLWEAMKRAGDESRSSGWNRRFIEKFFSKDVADRLRTTMRTIWRNDRPTMRSERDEGERDTILIRWQLGLAAIYAEAEDRDWAKKLSAGEAELACRYAPIELNGFPAWLEGLVGQHPESVERTLGPELTAALDEVVRSGSVGIMIQNIDHAPPEVARLFIPRLESWLGECSDRAREDEDKAAAVRRLQNVTSILLVHGDDALRIRIGTIAKERVADSEDDLFLRLWIGILLQLDPSSGADALERRIMALEPAADGLAIEWFASLFGEHHGRRAVDLMQHAFTPELLLRLVQLSYRYVRRSDDVIHEGSFSPDLRDDAEGARNTLLNALLESTGPEAWSAKIRISNDPLFSHIRDRLTMLAREKAAEEMDVVSMSESDVIAIDRYMEALPVTRDDIFSVMLDRLDDIEDLLLQDASPREMWAGINEERVMRRAIARELQIAENHIYSVAQESVTADEKETDIRIRAVSSAQQATIELKIGDKASAKVLLNALGQQLVTKYMAADTCRSGCLLVTVAKKQTWRDPDTREVMDFGRLDTMLKTEAARIVDNLGGHIRLTARLLDLRPRLPTERAMPS